jgi:hypothetical protein
LSSFPFLVQVSFVFLCTANLSSSEVSASNTHPRNVNVDFRIQCTTQIYFLQPPDRCLLLNPFLPVTLEHLSYFSRSHDYCLILSYLSTESVFLSLKGHILNPFLLFTIEHLFYFSKVICLTLSYLSPWSIFLIFQGLLDLEIFSDTLILWSFSVSNFSVNLLQCMQCFSTYFLKKKC